MKKEILLIPVSVLILLVFVLSYLNKKTETNPKQNLYENVFSGNHISGDLYCQNDISRTEPQVSKEAPLFSRQFKDSIQSNTGKQKEYLIGTIGLADNPGIIILISALYLSLLLFFRIVKTHKKYPEDEE